MPYSDREKQVEAEREVRNRERIYPALLGQKKLRRIDAGRQIAIMKEIAADYKKKADADPANRNPFGDP
jgi:hypothetical protein